MIVEYENTCANAKVVEELPDPKHVWYDGERIVVFSGSDVPREEVQEQT